jgi:hypothetical protein
VAAEQGKSDHAQQVSLRRRYARLRRGIEAAGFFVPDVGDDRGWYRLTCTSKHKRGYGYTGVILWVTWAAGVWYVQSPHPYCYQVRKPRTVLRACVALLSRPAPFAPAEWEGPNSLDALLRPITYQDYTAAIGLH